MGQRGEAQEEWPELMEKTKQLLRTLFSRRWWWVTLLVLALMIVLARLGIWQLDRLQQRRQSNRILAASLAAAPLDLANENLPDAGAILKDRQVFVSGEFDFDHQVMLKVQNWQGQAGAHLITPLVFNNGATAVLVDRGWIPEADNTPGARVKYDVPGTVTIDGFAALSQSLAGQEETTVQEPQDQWYRVDIEAMQRQMPYTLLPIYLLQAPDDNAQPPYRSKPENDLSEGNHLSYAAQWFIFSLGLGIAYILFVNKQMREQ